MRDESAFQTHVSGLLVPRDHMRQRRVGTKADWQALERATRVCARLGFAVFLRCDDPRCAAPLERLRRADGGITLRCDHRDVEFQDAF